MSEQRSGERLERVWGWGMAVSSHARVLRPRSREELIEALADVQDGSVALRGGGCSYGDAALNEGGRVIDLTGLDRILAFDAERGIARVEPGVTIRQLWRRAIVDGFWPPVVPGTMAVTAGGAAAMNIHGKNNFAAGTFGEHVLELTLVTPAGETLVCDRERHADVFHAVIGGFGMLGCIVELTLALKRVHSGRLRVTAIATRDLESALAVLDEQRADADYLVGWHDAYGRGRELGRGLIHRADQLAAGEDPPGERMRSPAAQDLPARLFGVVPKGWLWSGMWIAAHAGGIRFVNLAKVLAGRREAARPPYLQTHGAFHFLLDYVPGWKNAFLPGGLIQFQPFVPQAAAAQVLKRLIESSQQAHLLPYLLVLKRHRPDPFLMTHAVDGFSLAMDFAVTRRNREHLWRHCRSLAEIVLEAGGRFYYAKDAILESSAFSRIHGAEAVAEFRRLKERLDPAGRFATDLSRRLMDG